VKVPTPVDGTRTGGFHVFEPPAGFPFLISRRRGPRPGRVVPGHGVDPRPTYHPRPPRVAEGGPAPALQDCRTRSGGASRRQAGSPAREARHRSTRPPAGRSGGPGGLARWGVGEGESEPWLGRRSGSGIPRRPRRARRAADRRALGAARSGPGSVPAWGVGSPTGDPTTGTICRGMDDEPVPTSRVLVGDVAGERDRGRIGEALSGLAFVRSAGLEEREDGKVEVRVETSDVVNDLREAVESRGYGLLDSRHRRTVTVSRRRPSRRSWRRRTGRRWWSRSRRR
jgi:hypothetical protein